MELREHTAVLDRHQLREVTLDDDLLMREILVALVDDTKRQMVLLDAAIREQDATRWRTIPKGLAPTWARAAPRRF